MKQRPYFFFILAIIAGLLLTVASTSAQQPTWTATGSLGTARTDHTATLLDDGKVLVVGGYNRSDPISNAELYDPVTGQWSNVRSPVLKRALHKAVRMNNGKVLIIGGINEDIGSFPVNILFNGEVYDPKTGNWSVTDDLNIPRLYPEITLLADGKVMVTGGSGLGGVTNAAEIYNPATNTWRLVSGMNQVRVLHSSTLLPNGNVLVAGGVLNTVIGTSNGLRSAEVYDPISDRWSLTGELNALRATFPSVLLGNGKILVTGGAISSANSELYDPIIGKWSVTGSPKIIRTSPTLTVLPNGKALAIGGRDTASKVLSSFEIFDPATENWTLSSAILGFARASHTATLLQNGKVLVAGGTAGSGALRSAELFDSTTLSVANVSAANYQNVPLAPESIASAFGINLAMNAQVATDLPLPMQLAGVSVRVTDSMGTERAAPLFYVSPTQINYQIPPGTAFGLARVTISSGATGSIEIAGISPGLFSADSTGTGFAAAVVQRVKSNGEQTYEPIVKFDEALNRLVALPIDVGDPKDEVFLAVFGTGIRGRSSLTNVSAKVGATDVEVLYAGGQGYYAGLDQVNIRLPRILSGNGETTVAIVVDGVNANAVKIQIQ